MYSINVLVLTYKQENLIGRALDSVLCQKDWGLKHIIVQDDCSPDGTWNVLLKYKEKYPDIIVPYRNEHNLGIYGNFQQLHDNRGEADLYCFLAGDDTFCDGWFKAVQKNLEQRNIQLRGVAAVIGSDYKVVRPNGISLVIKNNRLLERKNIDPVSLKARNVIYARSTIETASLMERHKPIDLSKGLGVAEEIADIRKFIHADKFYYVPFVATIYYSQIGVSKNLNSENYYRSRIAQFRWMENDLPLNEKAKQYCQYVVSNQEFMIEPSLKNYLRMLKKYWKAFDRYTLYGSNFIPQLYVWYRMLKLLMVGKSK